MSARNIFSAILALLFAAAAPAAAHNQDPVEHDVMDVIETMFEGMRTGDADMVASTFADGAALTTTGSRDGQAVSRSLPIAQFIGSLRQAASNEDFQPWDERIWNVEIDVRDNLASAWMEYAFFAGERFSHCGVNTFQLARQADGSWKTIALADSRTPGPECDLDPDKVEETVVREALRHYLKGHETGQGSHHEQAFNPVANLYWMRDGEFNQRTSEAYIAGAPGEPAADEAERDRYIDWVDVSGTAAVGRIVLDYPGATIVDYMQLLKVDGRWQIVNKIFDVQPK